MGSAVLSFLTLSVVPGYVVERKTLNVDIVGRRGATLHLQYQARTTLLIWLPLIVAPDIILSLSGGFESPKIATAASRKWWDGLETTSAPGWQRAAFHPDI